MTSNLGRLCALLLTSPKHQSLRAHSVLPRRSSRQPTPRSASIATWWALLRAPPSPARPPPPGAMRNRRTPPRAGTPRWTAAALHPSPSMPARTWWLRWTAWRRRTSRAPPMLARRTRPLGPGRWAPHPQSQGRRRWRWPPSESLLRRLPLVPERAVRGAPRLCTVVVHKARRAGRQGFVNSGVALRPQRPARARRPPALGLGLGPGRRSGALEAQGESCREL
mmetsp:Transcript_77761/g.220393  ORF Transcript_77761/g.220393 Transcript_77761/m.220393 type:complete len:223 (+) Transcript_77761:3-671(+)